MVRANGGLPSFIIQREETKKKALEEARGRVISGTTKNGVIAVSIYDSKPVYILSTVHSEVKFLEIEKPVWSKAVSAHVIKKIPCLNLIHDYNNHMCHVDTADQLRGE